MKRLLSLSLLFFCGLFFINGCAKRESLLAGSTAPMIANCKSEIFHSKKIGDYKITVYHPTQPMPVNGWPIIYLLDGNSFFVQTVAIVKRQVHQAIVVAIDYPEQNRRELDYLPHPPELTMEILSNGKINIPHAYGGADNFLAFVQNELKPNLTQHFDINANQQIIFGHSLGGLWVLHTLFTQPNAFSYYIASSPSIWFSNRYILQEASIFIDQTENRALTKPTYLSISVGEFEQSLTGKELFPSDSEKQLRLKHLQNRRMVDNTKELAEQLSNANISELNLHYQLYPKQTHQSVAANVLDDRITNLLQSFSH